MSSLASTSQHSPSQRDLDFLRRAVHDPGFLASIAADPQGAFAEYGLSIDTDEIPSEVTLPSTESIRTLLSSDEESDTRTFLPWLGLIGG